MNLALARVGAGRVTAALMVAWGFASAATALVETPAQFYAMRLLVGAAESGVYPGMMLYLTYWFPAASAPRRWDWWRFPCRWPASSAARFPA